MKMKRLFVITVLVIVFSLGDAFSKYGRSCQDIGCLSNEICVLKEKPCTLHTRNDECGTYPSCEKKVGGGARTCENYVCPPSQICKVDKGMPKCFENPASTGMRENKRPVEAYNPISPNAEDMPSAPVFPSNPNTNYPHSNYPQQPNNPNYPQYPNSGMYPQLPSAGKQTTQRPNVYQSGHQSGHQYPSGGGYVGGQVGSGYPGYPQQGNVLKQAGGYPVQGGGYPVQGGGYPGQPYPGQGGYNTNPNARYPQQGGYPSQGNYYPGSTGNNQYGHKQTPSNSNPLFDKITNTLKTLGTNILKDALNIKL